MAKFGGVGSEALERKTGLGWSAWFEALDAVDAASHDHRWIVGYIAANFDVDPWWQQQITVGYEQARGGRPRHGKPSGFEISRSKTVNVPLSTLYESFCDARRRRAWLGESGLKLRTQQPGRSLRLDWKDGKTILAVHFSAKGKAKSSVTVQHTKLPDAKAADRMKTFWSERLERLRSRLES